MAEHQPTTRLTRFSQDGWGFVADAVAASPSPPVALHLGSFGFDTPSFVREAAKSALDRPNCNQYSPCNGRKSLRDAIAKTYSPLLGWTINPESDVVVTSGAIEGILSTITAFVNPGDEVIIFEPFYDQFVNNVAFVGGVVKLVPLLPPDSSDKSPSAGDWTISMERLEAAVSPKTKMLILNSPHNPIGKVFTKDEVTAIGNFCVKHNIIILSDEVYENLSYVPLTRMASISPEVARLTLTAGSAGKGFFMTGWRVGWIIGPPQLLRSVTRAHISICFSSVSPFQEAVASALESPECMSFFDQSKRDMEERMKQFNSIWDELGLKYYKPEGSYFVIVDMTELPLPDTLHLPEKYSESPLDCRISWFLTTVIGVAALPCSTFTTKDFQGLPRGSIRFSFGKSVDDLDLAKERLRKLSEYIKH